MSCYIRETQIVSTLMLETENSHPWSRTFFISSNSQKKVVFKKLFKKNVLLTDALKNFAKKTGQLYYKRLQHMCFPVNIAKLLRTTILKNISDRLLLNSFKLSQTENEILRDSNGLGKHEHQK